VKQLGDTGDRELVSQLLEEHEIDSVLHFSATGSYQNQSTTR
jgi:UDP-glucose 4-epimerase